MKNTYERFQQMLLKHEQTILDAFLCVLLLLFLISLCAFKVFDLDVWWHLKAGEIMWKTRSLIHTDPFAYTREGLPYLSTHEWLAQIIFFLTFRLGGFTGLILLRTLIVILTFSFLIAIGRKKKNLLPSVLVAMLAAPALLPVISDRPQLFSFALFALSLFVAVRFVKKGASEFSRKTFIQVLAIPFFFIEILWINLHGAAGGLVLLIAGALFLEEIIEFKGTGKGFALRISRILPFMLLFLALGLGLLLSPNGFHTITFFWSLLSDRTAVFIREWQPTELATYLKTWWLWWITALAALALARRRLFFWSILLLAFGILSRMSLRHEPFLLLTFTALIIDQFSTSERFEKLWQKYSGRSLTIALVTLICAFSIVHARRSYLAFIQNGQIAGYGALQRMESAHDFLEREGIKGPGFNSYDAGNELLFHGYPERKVFIDGRNVDYGYMFMDEAFRAGINEAVWRELDERYEFTHAIINYDLLKDEGDPMPYVSHLGKNPSWVLVYLDDWAAIYVKNLPEHRSLVGRARYRFLKPEDLETGRVLASMERGDFPALVEELMRSQEQSTASVNAQLLLARVSMGFGLFAEAQPMIERVLAVQPYNERAHQYLASLLVQQGEIAAAAEELERAYVGLGSAEATISYTAIADLFAQAGRPWKARYYRFLSALH